jgi:large subunit ribosomal protein L24
MKIKTKDTVLVLAGKDKGKKGEVKSVNPAKNKVVVAGVNLVSKHTKPSQNKQGGIVQVEAALDASNVALVCSKCKKAMTPKMQITADGKKIRVCRKCNEAII